MFSKQKFETPESIEFWLGAKYLEEKDDLPSGMIFTSANGSRNQVQIIRCCDFDTDVVGFHPDSEVAFNSLETEQFKKVIVDDGELICKEYKDLGSILSLEYTKDPSLQQILSHSSLLGTHLLKENGLLSIKIPVNHLESKDFRYQSAYKYIKTNIENAYKLAQTDGKVFLEPYLKAFAKARIPELTQDKIEMGIDIFRDIERTGIYKSLKEQIGKLEEPMLNCIIVAFYLFTVIQFELNPKNRLLRPQSMIFDLNPEKISCRVNGSVHRINTSKKFYVDKIYSLPPLLPNFIFINSDKYEALYNDSLDISDQDLNMEMEEYVKHIKKSMIKAVV